MQLESKIVLITGANRGIGRALVSEALARGARRVYAASRRPLRIEDPRVTPVTLDVTDVSQIKQAAAKIDTLDVLVNNAGIANPDDLSNIDAIDQHFRVNLYGTFNVTRAFLPQLTRSNGAIVNSLSVTSLAALPIMPAYSISKAAAFSLILGLRALLAGQGVTVHAAVMGPIDTDMTRGIDVPKASPESTAKRIFDGLQRGEEEIFPDPVSQPLADGWLTSSTKSLERQFAFFMPAPATAHA